MNNMRCDANHILIGLGGTGGKILREFKMRMYEEFPEPILRSKQPVQLLYVDSSDEMMPKDGKPRADFRVMGQDASFNEREFLYIKAVDVEHILNHINNYPTVKGIVDNVSAVKEAIGSLGAAAGQKRRAGRLLFAANAVAYVNAIKDAYARCEIISGSAEKTYFHIFAGLCGGTGSGSIIDAIVQTRKHFPDAVISVYAMIPEKNLPKSNMDQGRYYQNGYAAMNELNALQSGRFSPHDITGNGGTAKFDGFNVKKGWADGLTIYSNVNENGLRLDSLEELPKVVSDYVYARIFMLNADNKDNEDIIRAYSFENMDDFAFEYDETAPSTVTPKRIARTKKINSFGIKRVMYPELRILKHITYTVGESVLYQFKYNNWRENQGYVNEEAFKDYREMYLKSDNLSKWMLDDEHLLLEKMILQSDKTYPVFNDYWLDKSTGYADVAKSADCPLNELQNILKGFYDKHFRDCGVETYYRGKEAAVPDMAKEVRRTIEHELFGKWKAGDISIVELQKVSKLLLEHMVEVRKHIEDLASDEKENYLKIEDERAGNVSEWSGLNVLQRMVNKGARIYADHQTTLADMFVSQTRIVAIEFAKKLAARIFIELQKMNEDISAFGEKINSALDETERLLAAQQKVNKGLEDMKSAIIEVSEEERMAEFEVEIKIDKTDMPNIARQLREKILPPADFTNFGALANLITIDIIRDAFDVKLAEIVRTKHNEKAESDKKVLGLNILTQLQQKLLTYDDIKAFAYNIVKQSGVYLILNNDQMQLHVRNNEGNLSPTNMASINKKTILVSIPSPDDNPGLKDFADKLEQAFSESFRQGTSQTSIKVNRKSSRKDELSIITVGYCFPMRAMSWLSDYKNKYEYFLNTGNPATDASNAILLHSEADGKNLPSLFVVENAEQLAAEASSSAVVQTASSMAQPASSVVTPAPPMPPSGMPAPPPMQPTEPVVQLFLFIDGQQYGPYDWQTCKQFVPTGQLTPQTMVWEQGMAAWTPAGQVPKLAALFAPVAPAMPPMPPMGGPTPPPML